VEADAASAAGVGHLAFEPGIEVGIAISMLPRIAQAARAAVKRWPPRGIDFEKM
jgi:hypothetical protein